MLEVNRQIFLVQTPVSAFHQPSVGSNRDSLFFTVIVIGSSSLSIFEPTVKIEKVKRRSYLKIIKINRRLTNSNADNERWFFIVISIGKQASVVEHSNNKSFFRLQPVEYIYRHIYRGFYILLNVPIVNCNNLLCSSTTSDHLGFKLTDPITNVLFCVEQFEVKFSIYLIQEHVIPMSESAESRTSVTANSFCNSKFVNVTRATVSFW